MTKLAPVVALFVVAAVRLPAEPEPVHQPEIVVSWDKPGTVSRTTPTLQIVVNPMTRPGSPIHDATFAALKALHADHVRFVPWFPYPRLGVAELEPPTATTTAWDFALLDPLVRDFMEACAGRPTVMNFSTIPAWLFRTDQPVPLPASADGLAWDYNQGSELRDPTLKELGDYYARLVGWYVNGGFTDELGRRHESGHHFEFPVWEVLNEADFEHNTTAEQYTQRYDAIVTAIRRVSPRTRFMALALGDPSHHGALIEYFLDPAHHQPGIPIDYLSYHFYATPVSTESPDTWQYTFFDQADRFLATARYVELIRRRLAPATQSDLDEIGSILPGEPGTLGGPPPAIPDVYWNASAAAYAYVFGNLQQLGIEYVGESQLVGYPSQYPSVTMIDWKNGRPNARYWVLKLLVERCQPGDTLLITGSLWSDALFAQGFSSPRGKGLLIVNKRNRPIDVAVPKFDWDAEVVDPTTGEAPPRASHLGAGPLHLEPFAVAVLSTR